MPRKKVTPTKLRTKKKAAPKENHSRTRFNKWSREKFITHTEELEHNLEAYQDMLLAVEAERREFELLHASLSTLYSSVTREVVRAKHLHPGNKNRTLAFVEESGELVRACLNKDADDIEEECIQTMAMAIRLLIEGDSSILGEP
jgi:ADP-heptose:LPS heptosyltransferase